MNKVTIRRNDDRGIWMVDVTVDGELLMGSGPCETREEAMEIVDRCKRLFGYEDGIVEEFDNEDCVGEPLYTIGPDR